MDGPGGIPIGDGDSCIVYFDYVATIAVLSIVAYALWSVIFVALIIAGWFALLRLGLVPVLYPLDGSATDWDEKHSRILASASFIAAAIGYCFVVEVWIGQNTRLVWMFDFPALLMAFPFLTAIRYLASRS